MSKLINRYIEYIYVVIVVIAIIAAHACNPVKKVLNDPNKVQQVYNEYIRKNPTKPDTNTVYLPGDTITKVIIGYDTTVEKGKDSIVIKTLTKNIYTNRYIRDTLKITTRDTKLENDLRDMLTAREVVLDQNKIIIADKSDAVDKWRLRFFLLLGAVVVIGGLSIYLKTLNRVKI